MTGQMRNQMKPKRPVPTFLLICIAIALILIGFLWNRRRDHDATDNAPSPQITETPVMSAANPAPATPSPVPIAQGAPSSPAEAAPSSARPESLDEQARKVISSCLARDSRRLLKDDAADTRTLDALVSGFGTGETPRVNVSQWFVHIETPQGGKFRLRAEPEGSTATDPSDGANGARLKVEVFGVDADNLPVPMELPAEYRTLSPQQAVELFKSKGRVEVEEITQTLNWDKQTNAVTKTRNGHVIEAQMMFGNQSLGCAKDSFQGRVDCACMHD
jgi:hypothetical protein